MEDPGRRSGFHHRVAPDPDDRRSGDAPVLRPGRSLRGGDPDPAGLALVWPPFFHPTYGDKQAEATAITTLVDGGVMSRRKAVQTIGESYDLVDLDSELAAIAQDEAETALFQGAKHE